MEKLNYGCKPMKIILASASPRRKKLLEQIHLPFEIHPSTVQEKLDNSLSPGDLVKELAGQKGADVALKFPDAFIIAADTIVSMNDSLLGKPTDKTDAKLMLASLSGKTHEVYTGVYLAETGSNGAIKKAFTFSERTKVTFSALTGQEIDRYVQTGSPLDKAGAYGIQDDMGALFVKQIKGDYNNVVGFPLHSFYQNLKNEFPGLYNRYFSNST